MFASHRCQLSRLALVAGGLLLAGPAGAAITITGGSTSPVIPPAGTGQSFSTNGELSIGLGSTPTFVTVDRTSELSGGSVTVGSAAGSIGQVSVFDRGSKLVGTSGGLTVGGGGDGWVTATDGAVLDFNQTGGSVSIGGQATGVGYLRVSDPGSALLAGQQLLVGSSGYGEFELTNGAVTAVADDLLVAIQSGGIGLARIDGAGSRVIVADDVRVGDFGYGELYVSDGASLQAGGNFLVSGFAGVGEVSVSGFRSRVTVGEQLTIGSRRGFDQNAGGTLAISDSAIVDATGNGQAGGQPVLVLSDGRVELDSGTLFTRSLSVSGVLDGGGSVFGEVSIELGGRVEVPAGQDLQLMTQLETIASGDFLLAGGRLSLNGRLTHNTGDITLRDGAVLDTLAAVSTGVLAATSGVSDIYGAVTVEDLVIARDTTLVFHDGFTATSTSLQTNGSIVSLSPVSLSPTAATSMAISDPGDNAAISVASSMDLAGGLVVSASSAVEDEARVGDVYSLIDANNLNGSFDSFVLPSLTGGRYLRPQQTATGFELVVEGSIPGDFNLDNVVDAADYSLIRDGLGTTYTDVDLAVWAAYYGTVLSGPATAVPEPTAVMISLFGLLAGCGFRRAA